MDRAIGSRRPSLSGTGASEPVVQRANITIPGSNGEGTLSVNGPLSKVVCDRQVLEHTINHRALRVPEGETWMDFLRQASNGEQDPQERARTATVRRAAMVAADRKRRFTGQHEDYTRRRSVSTLSLGQTTRDKMRQSSAITNGENPLFASRNNLYPTIDVNRPLPQTPGTESPSGSRSGSIVLPKWQADSEVLKCPICGQTFTFWFRKHHCRKCGRVVCAGCSPHRITIPQQFIVQPPDEPGIGMVSGHNPNIKIVDFTEDDSAIDTSNSASTPTANGDALRPRSRTNTSLGGGQVVRLCNPCVPDPNPLPPLSYSPLDLPRFSPFPPLDDIPNGPQQQYRPTHRPSASLQMRLPSNDSPSSQPFYPAYPTHQVSQHGTGIRRQSLQSPSDGASKSTPISTTEGRIPTASNFPLNFRNSSQPGFEQATSAALHRHVNFSRPSRTPAPVPPPNPQPHSSSVPGIANHANHLDSLSQSYVAGRRYQHHASTSNIPTQSPYRSMLDLDTPLPPLPIQRPQLREEDECPICHLALPPKGPDGSETGREAHVASCIETNFSSSIPRASQPPPAAAIAAALAVNSARQPAARAENVPSPESRPEASQVISSSSVQRRRTTGMVIYHASEKDCLGADGEGAQECVICFEEFAVGDEMGRLECLCKFHKTCIRKWWDTKGPGSCPVHQGGL